MMPKRIQLRRTKGWRMPPDTVKVDRSTLFGNPFPSDCYGAIGAVDRFQRLMAGTMSTGEMSRSSTATDYSLVWIRTFIKQALPSLRDKNLACWCKLCPAHADGKPFDVTCPDCAPCHVDVLLELANTPLRAG